MEGRESIAATLQVFLLGSSRNVVKALPSMKLHYILVIGGVAVDHDGYNRLASGIVSWEQPNVVKAFPRFYDIV